MITKILKHLTIITFYLIAVNTLAQNNSARPRLVVGIVVDQMRWDFLHRYTEKYSAGGFKKLIMEGYNCEQTYINYFPTYTAPGHASIYTGSVPAIHGITGNNWFDNTARRVVYCTEDTTVNSLGESKKSGQHSPVNMFTTTICDELRIATNFKSKTVGIALKDRGAILPAGHAATAAYWYEGNTGNWISSSYYMKELPTWVKKFNEQKLAEKYVKQNWKTLLELATYTESTEDDKWYENPFSNEDKPVFIHKTSEIKKEPLTEVLRSTPFGNTLTFEFAKAAIEGDTLGQRKATDFLAISFSSTDYIGHQFGPNAIETQDAYLRFDLELEDFLTYLDKKIGKGNYLLFLTADHGAAHATGFNKEKHIPAGNIFEKAIFKYADSLLQLKYRQKNLISAVINQQIFLNHDNILTANLSVGEISHYLAEKLNTLQGIDRVIVYQNLQQTPLPAWFRECLNNHYKPGRTGDLQLLFHPAWFNEFERGTTHGSIFPYDTHIPLIFYGWNIKPGKDYSRTYITDIAPTLSALLKIQEPNGSIGKVITGLFK
ncbi:MAG: alkaline phosphatase family protein [Chitinophagales bacterium]|nr:alkaline phosphatase family protein [Chitinophagales bacterium]